MTEHWWEDLNRPEVVGATLVRRQWTRPIGDASYDHDHCVFCSAKFSDTVHGALREGFATMDEALWACADCVNIPELRERFRLTTI